MSLCLTVIPPSSYHLYACSLSFYVLPSVLLLLFFSFLLFSPLLPSLFVSSLLSFFPSFVLSFFFSFLLPSLLSVFHCFFPPLVSISCPSFLVPRLSVQFSFSPFLLLSHLPNFSTLPLPLWLNHRVFPTTRRVHGVRQRPTLPMMFVALWRREDYVESGEIFLLFSLLRIFHLKPILGGK